MLTIFLDDLLERPAVEFHKMLTFIDGKFSREDMISAIEKHKTSLDSDIGRLLYMSIENQLNIPIDLIKIATETFQSEFDKTSYLTKWPCPSFRELENNKVAKLVQAASVLSANCSDPFVTCSVRFDQNGG